MADRQGRPLFGSTLPPQEEAPSQAMLPVTDQAVLFWCRPSPALDALGSRLLALGLRPKFVATLEQAPEIAVAPSCCFVDWSLPGAPNYIASLSRSADDLAPIAIVASCQESAAAFEQGAVATLHQPLSVDEVLACLKTMRSRRERQRLSDAVLQHDQRISAATAFEAMLRSLGQELRTPLATALANVEYLAEVAQSATSPLSEEEHLAVATDTLEAMQRLRATLEGMSVLGLAECAVLEQVRLWRVAQRVLDELPSGTTLVELEGDLSVRGWGDESKLVEVTSLLVKRAIARQDGSQGQRVTLHVYAHDTEARLTVREAPPSGSWRRTTEDPFTPARVVHGRSHGGLELVAARHAIVKMGGTLSYVAQKEAGCAFRVRLRLAQPVAV